MKLATTLRSWLSKYGSEAAFVGRVAVAAFIPPGASVLIEKGLEAAFEYIQDHPDKLNEQALQQYMAQSGISTQQTEEVNHLVSQIHELAPQTLEHAFESQKAGKNRNEIESVLREFIASDPTLRAIQSSIESINRSLNQLSEQSQVLIAGQVYQTQAIEEMMSMLRNMAVQLQQGQGQSVQSSHFIPSLQQFNVNQRITPISQTDVFSDSLSSFETASQKQTATVSASDLVARFKALTQAQSSQNKLDTSLDAFSKLDHSSAQESVSFEQELVGTGRVALELTEVGHQPLQVIKWLCETWSYSLSEAIILTQSIPSIIRRSNHFVELAQAQSSLVYLGAKLKLNT